MNINEAVVYCGEYAGCTNGTARKVLDALMQLVVTELAEDGNCYFPFVGTMKYKKYDAYDTKDPRTGNPIHVESRWRVHLKASQRFLARLEEKRKESE